MLSASAFLKRLSAAFCSGDSEPWRSAGFGLGGCIERRWLLRLGLLIRLGLPRLLLLRLGLLRLLLRWGLRLGLRWLCASAISLLRSGALGAARRDRLGL